MKKYVAQWDYRSYRGSFGEGDVVECSEEEASWYNRDSPGVLVPVGDSPSGVEGRAMEGPPRDRMMRETQTRTEEEKEPDATDAAAELAAEHGIDLSEVEGTGVDGRILKGDVEALIEEEE